MLPGQEAVIRFQLLHILRVECGAYVLRVPIAFFPEAVSDYNYTFSGSISAKTAITYLSAPDKCLVERDAADYSQAKIERSPESGLTLSGDLVIYYRTANMEAETLLVQKSTAHPDQLALMFSFVPSFQESTASTEFETATEERPEPQELPASLAQTDNFFVFIVDRSGSMSGSKMNTTNEALVLFLKSLPAGSRFDIISFGSRFDHMCKDSKGFEYNDRTVNEALEKIKGFSADYGGTEIFEPMTSAII